MQSLFRKVAALALIAAIGGMALTVTTTAQASNRASIEIFHATCSNFTVDVAVSGATNDLDGFDFFRYLITDANGKKLYQEDSARQTGVTDRAFVYNLPYDADGVADGTPTANPIRFSVIDIDIVGKPVATLTQLQFNAACLVQGVPSVSLADLLPAGIPGTMRAATMLYATPDSTFPLGVTVEAGREFTALYRTGDSQWIGLYVGGENLVWVPGGMFEGETSRIAVQPTRIDRSQQVTGAVIPGPALATAVVNYRSNYRTLPSLAGRIIGRIPWRTVVPVYGRSANSGWLLVQYNGLGGWIAARLVRLQGVKITDLPIVG